MGNPAHGRIHMVRVSYKGITLDFQSNDRGSIPLSRFNSKWRNIMSKFFGMVSKVFYILAILSILFSVHIYQTDSTLGIFIGLWVPTLLLLGPTCPWASRE